jgi:hypothetical protein
LSAILAEHVRVELRRLLGATGRQFLGRHDEQLKVRIERALAPRLATETLLLGQDLLDDHALASGFRRPALWIAGLAFLELGRGGRPAIASGRSIIRLFIVV